MTDYLADCQYGKNVRIGPAAPAGATCVRCELPAKVQCQPCGTAYCAGRCWWSHGTAADPHRIGDEAWVGIRAGAAKGGVAK